MIMLRVRMYSSGKIANMSLESVWQIVCFEWLSNFGSIKESG
jgi:hypothetical protein